MSIHEIVLAGNPLLKKKSLPIEDFSDPTLHELIQNLFDTMDFHNGVGLASPQIGILKRVIVYGFTYNPRYPNEKPVQKTALLNPEILELSEDIEEYYEGCLCLPDLRGLVPRSNTILYKANLPNGQEIRKTVSGFEARIIQHEVDHLDGILFPKRMKNIETLAMFEELKKQA